MELDSSNIPSQQPAQAEAIIYMDSDLFNAAEDGNLGPFTKYEGGGLHCLVDGRRNTALHIYSRTGEVTVATDTRFLSFPGRTYRGDLRSSHFVEQVVDKCPSLLLQPNDKGEIPLNIPVRQSNYVIVDFLIKRAKAMPLPQHEDLDKATSSEPTGCWVRRMLRMKDKEGNTAFHIAAEIGSLYVVEVEQMMEELDPDFSFSANDNGETPLYLSAKESLNHDMVAEILEHCKSGDYGGPDTTTALHAALGRHG